MRWKIIGSDDTIHWHDIVSFYCLQIAQAAFELEIELKRWKHLRLVSPEGETHERVCVDRFPNESIDTGGFLA